MNHLSRVGGTGRLRGWRGWVVGALLGLSLAGGTTGCVRPFYRKLADKDVDKLLEKKDQYPQWAIEAYHVYPDLRARFADPTNPDFPPMPPDDPAAWRLACKPQKPYKKAGVAYVEGDGYLPILAEWDQQNRAAREAREKASRGDQGQKEKEIERPQERTPNPYGIGSEDTDVEKPFLLTFEQAIDLGQFNSREFQNRREDLYLTALPVTLERYAFATQFQAINDTIRERTGEEAPEGYHNRWRHNSTLGLSQFFVTGASLVVTWANRTVIELTRDFPKHTISLSDLNLDFIQPFLRGGGKAVTLEPLTQVQRNLVYEIRNYAHFRKEFFVAIAAGLDISQGGLFTVGLGGLAATGGVLAPSAGYLPTVLQAVQVEVERANYEYIQRELLPRFQEQEKGGVIDPLQADQVEQQLLDVRTRYLTRLLNYRNALDLLKIQLGLPTELPLELDDAPLRPIINQVTRFDEMFRQLEAAATEAADLFNVPVAQLRGRLLRILTGSPLVQGIPFREQIERRWGAWQKLTAKEFAQRVEEIEAEIDNLVEREEQLAQRDQELSAQDQRRLRDLRFEQDLARLESALRLYESRPWEKKPIKPEQVIEQTFLFGELIHRFNQLLGEARNQRLDQIRQSWPELPKVVLNGQDLIQADLVDAQDAVAQTAIINRFELMNARAQLVDAWRQIAVFANALLGVFNVQYSMLSNTPPTEAQPFAFSGSRTRHDLILHTELPLVRRAERNDYRAILIGYQRQRRELMAREDFIVGDVRTEIRQLRVLAENYKIQQRAVELAYSVRENAFEVFNAPQAPGGQVGGAGNAAAITNQLLNAQNRLPGTLSQIYQTWTDYLIFRMQLYRDLELMQLDARGVWINDAANFQSCPPDDGTQDAARSLVAGNQAGPAGERAPRTGPVAAGEEGPPLE